MATYNNKHWLLSHIRNSFISTDDTGILIFHNIVVRIRSKKEINFDVLIFRNLRAGDEQR